MIYANLATRPVVTYAGFVPGVHEGALSEYECNYLIESVDPSVEETLSKETRHEGDYMSLERVALTRFPQAIEGFNQRIAEKLLNAASRANDTLWRFDISRLREMSILRYNPGQKYSMHVDLVNNRSLAKLSVVALLSNESEYEGGELEIMANSDEFDTVSRQQGTVYVFPSYVPHRVVEVTSGQRWTLAAWVEGPPFR